MQSKKTLEEAKQIVYLASDGSLEIKDRKHRMKTYKSCFTGTDFVKFLVENQVANSAEQAVCIGQEIVEHGLMYHVLKDHGFKNEGLFYRFLKDDVDHGHRDENSQSWNELEQRNVKQSELKEFLAGKSDMFEKNCDSHVPDLLLDKFNCEMFDNVRPLKWVDPEVDGDNKYDILVIGAGAGGLVTAAGSAGLGAKACMIERLFIGGDCLVNGCVPSKAFLKACNVAHAVKNSQNYGISFGGEISIDFAKLMGTMKQKRAQVSHHDAAKNFTEKYGVDVFLGHAKFLSPTQVSVNGKTLSFSKACIASGARPTVPKYKGLETIDYLTSDTVFNLTEQPKTMLVVGSGPIGCELGQGFARISTEVTMFVRGKQILPKDDYMAAKLLQEQMQDDGINFSFETTIQEFKEDGTVEYTVKGEKKSAKFDKVLFAIGRTPNVEDMGLEKAGVKYDAGGIAVNDKLQTANKNIYAVGDCIPGARFTHNSDVQARTVIKNALFYGGSTKSEIILPYCTFTTPEIATVGLNEQQLKEKGIQYDVYSKDLNHIDRAICDSVKGHYTIYCKKGKDDILGATLVGGPAGDLIVQITSSMHNQIGLSKMGACVHPYPSYAEAFKGMADAFNRTKLGPTTRCAIRGLLSIQK